MTTSNMEFPLRMKRQYPEPFDADAYAETKAELDDIKTRANSYIGMMVSCREDGLVYVLGTDMEFTPLVEGSATTNFIKTYTSLTQIGLTDGSETIEDIAKNMKDFTKLIINVEGNFSNVPIYPYQNGTLIVERVNLYRVHFKFCKDSSTEVYVGTYNVLSGFTGWTRLCTTSVADVPKTNIAPADETTFIDFKGNGNCNYCVRNGVCYVTLWDVKIATTGTVKTGVFLPKCAGVRAGSFMTGNGDATPHAYVYILSDTGELLFDVKDANTTLYGPFSYPVSES